MILSFLIIIHLASLFLYKSDNSLSELRTLVSLTVFFVFKLNNLTLKLYN